MDCGGVGHVGARRLLTRRRWCRAQVTTHNPNTGILVANMITVTKEDSGELTVDTKTNFARLLRIDLSEMNMDTVMTIVLLAMTGGCVSSVAVCIHTQAAGAVRWRNSPRGQAA